MKTFIFFITGLLLFYVAISQDSGFQGDFAGTLQNNVSQIQSLAGTIPEDFYNWSLGEGVRSIQEVIMHVVSANYFFGMMMGATPLEGIDPMTIGQTVKGKANIIQALQNSDSYITNAGKGVSDDNLEDLVDFPDGNKYSKGMAMLIALNHTREHKVQLIAYARMNHITPPWSQQE
jgi:uncharacterized damage-inducible protein DinB